MSWLRLLGYEGLDARTRATAFQVEHPDLASRVGRLLDELEAAGLQPDRWPYPPETANARQFQMGLMVLKATEGYEAMIEALEERWAQDHRNPDGSRHGPTPLPGATAGELEAIRDKLKSAGQAHGYKAIAKEAGVSVSTVRRRFGVLN